MGCFNEYTYDDAGRHYPARLKLTVGHKNWVLCVAWSPDAEVIATGSYDNTVTSRNEWADFSYGYGTQIQGSQGVMHFEDILSG